MSTLDFSGRYYAYTDLRWIGQRTAYGVSSENHSQSYGTGALPSLPRDAQGHLVRAGDVVDDIAMRLDSSSTQITAVAVALVHKSVSGVVTVLWSNMSFPITTDANDAMAFVIPVSPIAIPSDGILVFSMKPIGVLTGTRYIYSSINLRLSSALPSASVVTTDMGDKWAVQSVIGGVVVATLMEIDKASVTGSQSDVPIYRVRDTQ